MSSYDEDREDDGRALEREDVIAFLRNRAELCDTSTAEGSATHDLLLSLAEAIERGDHAGTARAGAKAAMALAKELARAIKRPEARPTLPTLPTLPGKDGE